MRNNIYGRCCPMLTLEPYLKKTCITRILGSLKTPKYFSSLKLRKRNLYNKNISPSSCPGSQKTPRYGFKVKIWRYHFQGFCAISIYSNIQGEVHSIPEMHPTVINAHPKLLTRVWRNLDKGGHMCVMTYSHNVPLGMGFGIT